jgi:hypothetical protein
LSLHDESATFKQQVLRLDPLGRTVKSQLNTLTLIQVNIHIQVQAALRLASTISKLAEEYQLLNTIEGARFTADDYISILEHVADMDANNEALRRALNTVHEA